MVGFQTGVGFQSCGGVPDTGGVQTGMVGYQTGGIPNAGGVLGRGRVTTLTSHQSEILHSLIVEAGMEYIHHSISK